MTAPITTPTNFVPLTLIGEPSAAACEGDFCVIPDNHVQAVVNRRLDEDLV